jgi:hypothetical protein
MFKFSLFLFGMIIACDCASGQGDGNDTLPAKVKARAAELRERLAIKTYHDDAAEDRKTTVAALATIVRAESASDGAVSTFRYRALQELGRFPDVPAAIDLLIEEIDYGESRYVDSSPPISYYPAAISLVRIGARARGRILRVLDQPLPDHQLSLMVTVLVEMDQDEDGMDGMHGSPTALTMFRLSQELEQLKARAFAPEREEDRVTRIRNVKRMIALLLEPSYGLKLPSSAVRQGKPASKESLIEEFLREEPNKPR